MDASRSDAADTAANRGGIIAAFAGEDHPRSTQDLFDVITITAPSETVSAVMKID